MTLHKLYFSGICSGNEDIPRGLKGIMQRLSEGYFDLYKKQSKESETLKNAEKGEFFGLRDFYRLKFTTFYCSTNVLKCLIVSHVAHQMI